MDRIRNYTDLYYCLDQEELRRRVDMVLGDKEYGRNVTNSLFNHLLNVREFAAAEKFVSMGLELDPGHVHKLFEQLAEARGIIKVLSAAGHDPIAHLGL